MRFTKKEDRVARSLYTLKKTLKKNLLKRTKTPGNFMTSLQIPLFVNVINDAVFRTSQIVNEAWLFSNLLILAGLNRHLKMPALDSKFFSSCLRVVSSSSSTVPLQMPLFNTEENISWWNESVACYNLMRGNVVKISLKGLNNVLNYSSSTMATSASNHICLNLENRLFKFFFQSLKRNLVDLA